VRPEPAMVHESNQWLQIEGPQKVRTSTGNLIAIGFPVLFLSRKEARQPNAGALIRGNVVGWYGINAPPATATKGVRNAYHRNS
jgi:hypothetical protein